MEYSNGKYRSTTMVVINCSLVLLSCVCLFPLVSCKSGVFLVDNLWVPAMIVIKIELHSAVTGKITQLGEAYINNQGVLHEGDKCDYEFKIMRKPKFKSVTKMARVEGWPRSRRTVWQLLQKCLNQAYGLR